MSFLSWRHSDQTLGEAIRPNGQRMVALMHFFEFKLVSPGLRTSKRDAFQLCLIEKERFAIVQVYPSRGAHRNVPTDSFRSGVSELSHVWDEVAWGVASW
jgi:hypothetical protein